MNVIFGGFAQCSQVKKENVSGSVVFLASVPAFHYKLLMRIFIAIVCATYLFSCSVDHSDERSRTLEEELQMLSGPAVPTIESSLETAAIAALKEGSNGKALSLYEQLHDKNPNEMRYVLGLAESLRRSGQSRPAIEFYNIIIEKHPGHLDAHEGKALAIMEEGRFEEASQLLGLVLKRDPKRWRTLNALGIMFAARGMADDALAYLEEAKKYSPDNPSVLNNAGLAQAVGQRFNDSVLTLSKAAKKAEGVHRKQIELNMALVYGISGDMQQARRVAERHLKGAALDNNLGLYAHLANNSEMAKSYLNMALSGSTVHYERAWENLDIITTETKPRDLRPGERSYRISPQPVNQLQPPMDVEPQNQLLPLPGQMQVQHQ
ncbi:MAG: tetratricopeptide repeat protein [Rickettsiales bacterium]|nr:tetratricopeptide repeat protein [Rickettsiales bacterium]